MMLLSVRGVKMKLYCQLIDMKSAQVPSVKIDISDSTRREILGPYKDLIKKAKNEKPCRKEVQATAGAVGDLLRDIVEKLALNLEEIDSLAILVDDRSSEIPWELALLRKRPRKSICEQVNLGRMRAVRSSQWYNKERTSRKPKALVVGINNGLTHAEREAEKLVGLFVENGILVKPLIGKKEATREAIKSELNKEVDVFHFTGHGNLKRGKDSSIKASDGEIYSRELVKETRDASFPTMCFLNACLTSTERTSIKESNWDPYSWASAFLENGSSVFVGSLWPIGDEASSKFALEFYKELLTKENRTLGKAFRRARLMTQKLKDPYQSWLSFSLYGSPDIDIQSILW